MTAPLFDPEKCGNLDSVPSLDFNFVSDCSIESPPPPIFDCAVPLVPREPPPICPEFTGNVNLRTGIKGCASAPSEAAAAFAVTQTSVNPCRFAFDLDLSIPFPKPPCPQMSGGSVDISVVYATPGGLTVPSGTIHFTKTEKPSAACSESANCEFTLDLALKIPVPQPPCPTFNAGEINVTAGFKGDGPGCVNEAGGSLMITKEKIPGNASVADSCRFTLDLALQVPIPKPPCPAFNADATIAYDDTLDEPTVDFTATPTVIPGDCNTPDSCTFDLNLDIAIPKPPCPTITASAHVTVTPGIEAPTLALVVNKATESCAFNLDLSLEVPTPQPCPMMYGSVTVHEADELSGNLIITRIPPEQANEACEFDLTLDIGIPRFCPTFTAQGSVRTDPAITTPHLSAAVHTDSVNCAFDLALALVLPPVRGCPTVSGHGSVHYTEDEPALALNVTKTTPEDPATGCSYALALDLALPYVRACPVMEGTASAHYTTGTTPTAAFTITPTEPEDPTAGCHYALALDIGIPEACVPTITADATVTEVEGLSAPTADFSVTEDPASCAYYLNFNLDLPKPICPTFNGSVRLYETATPAAAMTFTRDSLAPARECNFKALVNLGLRPYPRLYRRTVNCYWGSCADQFTPELDLSISPPDESNRQYIDFDLKIPKPPIYEGGMLDLGSLGMGTLTIDRTVCTDPVINGSITLITTACQDTPTYLSPGDVVDGGDY